MRRLLVVVLVAAGLWSGWWMVGSQGAKAGFAGWFETRRAAGWQADYADLTLRGFPNRFDATFTDLVLADPGTGWVWSAPFFQVLALSYQPNHVIAVWPDRHRLSTPEGPVDITSAALTASIRVDAGPALALARANLVAETLTLTDARAEAATATALRAAVERVDGTAESYRIGFTAEDLSLPAGLRRLIGASDRLPPRLSAFRADLTARFDRPWDRSAIETARPQPVAIDLALAEAKWGDLELALAGKVAVADGTPEGSVTIKARNWREMLVMARTSGALAPALADQAEGILGMLARTTGHPETLDLPLTFRGGLTFVGPLPVGPAPRLVLR